MGDGAKAQQAQQFNVSQMQQGTGGELRVLSVTTGDGGVDFTGLGVRTYLTTPTTAEGKAGPLGSLEMSLSKALGGVVVRYTYKNEPRRYLVPMAHLRRIELEP